MIRKVEQEDIKRCVEVIRKSFGTVADEFGLTIENAPSFTAFSTTEEKINWHLNGEHRHKGIGDKLLEHAFVIAKGLGCAKMNIGIVEENELLKRWYASYGFVYTGTHKYDFFPFTCGYMERGL